MVNIGGCFLQIEAPRAVATEPVESPYATLTHGTPYKIVLHTLLADPCDVELFVDGKRVDTFRVEPGYLNRVVVDGPPGDSGRGRFTAFLAGSDEAKAAGGDGVTKDDRGLVTAVFRPGKPATSPAKRPKKVRPVSDVFRDLQKYWPPARPYNEPYPKWPTLEPRWIEPESPRRYEIICQSETAGTVAPAPLHIPVVTYSSTMSAAVPAAAVTGLTGHTDQAWETAEPIVYTPDAEVTLHLRVVCVSTQPAVRPLESIPPRSTPIPPPKD